MIPPAYCVTLRQTPERWAAAAEHFRAHGLSVTPFHGVHGDTWGIGTEKWFRDHGETGDGDIPPGHVGNNLSHWMLWTHLWHAGVDEALIFEDDATLVDDFAAEYAKTRAALPDGWQFWFVGTVGTELKELVIINERLCRTADCPFGMHAYIVRRSALEVMLPAMQAASDHVDIQLWRRALPELSWCVSWPNLAGQRTYTGEWDGLCSAVRRRQAIKLSQQGKGWCTPRKAGAIFDLVTGLLRRFPHPLRCVELGVFHGRSLLAAAVALQFASHGVITGIDPYSVEASIEGMAPGHPHRKSWEAEDYVDAEQRCREAIARHGLAGVCELVKSMPDAIVDWFSEPIHYLHVDDCHAETAALRNVRAWLPKIAAGGLLVLDDTDWETVQPARQYVAERCTLLAKESDPDGRWEVYRC